ncbi:hypothetical protein WB403_49985, partial [Streptomyces brasiliscabiei]
MERNFYVSIVVDWFYVHQRKKSPDNIAVAGRLGSGYSGAGSLYTSNLPLIDFLLLFPLWGTQIEY